MAEHYESGHPKAEKIEPVPSLTELAFKKAMVNLAAALLFGADCLVQAADYITPEGEEDEQ